MASDGGFDLDRDALAEEAPAVVAAAPTDAAAATGSKDALTPLTDAIPSVPEEDETTRRLREASEWKERGNAAYLLKDYAAALTYYDSALEVCPGSSELHEEEVPEDTSKALPSPADPTDQGAAEASPVALPPRTRLVGVGDSFGPTRSVYHCNRAACLQQLGRDDEAAGECSIAVALDPKYVKAFVRRGQAYEKLQRYADAVSDMDKALALEPTLKLAKTVRDKCAKLEDERLEKLKTETMAKLKDLGNSLLSNFGLSTDNFKFDKDPKTGSYNIQFVQKP